MLQSVRLRRYSTLAQWPSVDDALEIAEKIAI